MRSLCATLVSLVALVAGGCGQTMDSTTASTTSTTVVARTKKPSPSPDRLRDLPESCKRVLADPRLAPGLRAAFRKQLEHRSRRAKTIMCTSTQDRG